VRYEFHSEALAEYQEAARFYAEREPGLERHFVRAVEDAIQHLSDVPDRCRVLDEDVRRCLTHVFPYAVLYTIETDYVLVVAVMHCSREPGYWKGRIG